MKTGFSDNLAKKRTFDEISDHNGTSNQNSSNKKRKPENPKKLSF